MLVLESLLEVGTGRVSRSERDDNTLGFCQVAKRLLLSAGRHTSNATITTEYPAAQKTDVPILLNTSFNDREPIVESPTDAINCFMTTKIYYLYFYEYGILVSHKKGV